MAKQYDHTQKLAKIKKNDKNKKQVTGLVKKDNYYFHVPIPNDTIVLILEKSKEFDSHYKILYNNKILLVFSKDLNII